MITNHSQNVWSVSTLFGFYVFSMFAVVGCSGLLSHRVFSQDANDILDAVNAARAAENLPLLVFDEKLSASSEILAKSIAKNGVKNIDQNRLATLVKDGNFARFALIHNASAQNIEELTKKIKEDPIAKAKMLHKNITHVGIGFASGKRQVFVVLDLARVIRKIDIESSKKDIVAKIQKKRAENSVSLLKSEEKLSEQAVKVATSYMSHGDASKGDTSDALIAQARQSLSSGSFSLGKISITFQVASGEDAVIIPSIISDPAVEYFGIGICQGNHPNHEPGALAMVLLLAEAQADHETSQSPLSIPDLKTIYKSQRQSPKGPALERAWVATLSGSHRKAAALFLESYRKTKDKENLYEAARAYARDENLKKALETMREYTKIASEEKKQKALDMAAKLEKGESIFSTSEKKTMSLEAARFFAIGQRLFEQGEWDGAIDAFQQAYTYAEHPDIIYNIGLAHSKAGRIGKALQFFDEYQRLVPEASNVNEAKQSFDIGATLFRAGQFEVASRYFALSYAYMPLPHIIYNLGICYKAVGQNDMAVRFFREYLDTDPPKKDRDDVTKMIVELQK